MSPHYPTKVSSIKVYRYPAPPLLCIRYHDITQIMLPRCRAKTWYPLQGPRATEVLSSIMGTTKPISPGSLSGVGNELKSGIHIRSTSLVIGYVIPVKMKDLATGQGFMVSDILQVHLHDLKRLS